MDDVVLIEDEETDEELVNLDRFKKDGATCFEFADLDKNTDLNDLTKLISASVKKAWNDHEPFKRMEKTLAKEKKEYERINRVFTECEVMFSCYDESRQPLSSGSEDENDIKLLPLRKPLPTSRTILTSQVLPGQTQITGNTENTKFQVIQTPVVQNKPTTLVSHPSQTKLTAALQQQSHPSHLRRPQLQSILQGPKDYSQTSQAERKTAQKSCTIKKPNTSISLAPGMKLFGKKRNGIWYKATLVDIIGSEKPIQHQQFKLKFDSKGMRDLTAKEIALVTSMESNLTVGSRVIALYKDEDTASNYYAGVIAEAPSSRNSGRYLIFFDDGYAQYNQLREVKKVVYQSKEVWDDVHPDSLEFIKSYLMQYPERPMVRMQKHQTIRTEWMGTWWTATVQDLDSSLVKMYFEDDGRIEWIYRGSTRLEPLFTELANAEASKLTGKGGRRHNVSAMKNKKPVVEYTGHHQQEETKRRPVAKKSTNNRSKSAMPMNIPCPKTVAAVLEDRLQQDFSQDENVLGEEVRRKIQSPERERVKFKRHSCSPNCVLGKEADPKKFLGRNPLLIPMFCMYERQLAKQKNTGKRVVIYRAPCGRRLRSLDDTDHYLYLTDSLLTIDLFCFDYQLHTHTEFVPIKTFYDYDDLSHGKENVKISCVNGIDNLYPEFIEYSNVRMPAKGVPLNTDREFLVGCSCTDGCRDKERCECIQRTIEATAPLHGGKAGDPSAGYDNRRLKEQLVTGIYECNANCPCDSRCKNRVAQNPLSLRLQVFKTDKRGWGLRCLDDIPEGGFICIYVGILLTEQAANEDGQRFGDEYLAELDYIEVVENLKEGYEDTVDPELDEGVGDEEENEDEEGEDDSENKSEDEEKGQKLADSDSTYSDGYNYEKRRRRKNRSDNKGTAGNKQQAQTSNQANLSNILINQQQQNLVKMPWNKQLSANQQTAQWIQSIPQPKVASQGLAQQANISYGVSQLYLVKGQGATGAEMKPAACDEIVILSSSDEEDKSEPKPDETKVTGRAQPAKSYEDDIVQLDGPYHGSSSSKSSAASQSSTSVLDDIEFLQLNDDIEQPPSSQDGSQLTVSLRGGLFSCKGAELPQLDGSKDSRNGGEDEVVSNSSLDSLGEKKVKNVQFQRSAGKIKLTLKSSNEKSDERKESLDVNQMDVKEEDMDALSEPNEAPHLDELRGQDREPHPDGPPNLEAEHHLDHSEAGDQNEKSPDPAEEPSALVITEPTSMNIEEQEDEEDSNDEREGQFIRMTRSQSRFHNLPDPKAKSSQENKKEADESQEKESGALPGIPARKAFGDEYCYVMDAKVTGNIGRYLNHSCAPNVFVQNVFVDTHDLRFPWVAFFAGQYIRAGTELTWDYNYEVGSVPGKVLYCYCGAAECRGRLL